MDDAGTAAIGEGATAVQLQTLGCFQTLVRLVGAPTALPAVSDMALWLLQDIVTAHAANHEAVEVRRPVALMVLLLRRLLTSNGIPARNFALQWLVALVQNVRDLCTSRRSATLRWTTRLEPLDHWEVVGDYYAPAKPPVRSSMDFHAADGALAVIKARPVDSSESGLEAADPSVIESAPAVPTSAQEASSLSTATTQGVAGTTGLRTADSAPLLRISAYTAERLFQVLAEVASHAEHGAALLPRLRDLGVVEAVLDVIEVQRWSGQPDLH